jgi:hypothetical protein
LTQLPVAFSGGSRAHAEPGDAAVEHDVAAVQIGHHIHRLTDAHAIELHFLEIGLHPQPLEGYDGHEG